MDFYGDDPRGLRKKKSNVARILAHWSKLSWVFLIILIIFVLQLRSHKKSLQNEVDQHKNDKDSLKSQLDHLDSRVTQKTRELQEVQKLNGQTTQTALQRQNRLTELQSLLEGSERSFKDCAHSLSEANTRLSSMKCEDCSKYKDDLQNERIQISQLRSELHKLKIQLEYATSQLKNPDIPHRQVDDEGVRVPHDDHIDAAIATGGEPTPTPPIQPVRPIPPPVVHDDHHSEHHYDHDDHHEEVEQQQQQQQEQERQGSRFRRWGSRPVPDEDQNRNAHVEEHQYGDHDHHDAGAEEEEVVRAPLPRRRRGRRKGGLSMLEEHMGVEHHGDDDGDMPGYRHY